jgi:hypothetical protein
MKEEISEATITTSQRRCQLQEEALRMLAGMKEIATLWIRKFLKRQQ